MKYAHASKLAKHANAYTHLYFNILHVSKLSAPIYGVFIKHGLFLFFLSSFHSPCSLLNFAPYHFLTCHFYLVFSLSHCTVASSYQTLSIAITLHKIRRDIIITFFLLLHLIIHSVAAKRKHFNLTIHLLSCGLNGLSHYICLLACFVFHFINVVKFDSFSALGFYR